MSNVAKLKALATLMNGSVTRAGLQTAEEIGLKDDGKLDAKEKAVIADIWDSATRSGAGTAPPADAQAEFKRLAQVYSIGPGEGSVPSLNAQPLPAGTKNVSIDDLKLTISDAGAARLVKYFKEASSSPEAIKRELAFLKEAIEESKISLADASQALEQSLSRADLSRTGRTPTGATPPGGPDESRTLSVTFKLILETPTRIQEIVELCRGFYDGSATLDQLESALKKRGTTHFDLDLLKGRLETLSALLKTTIPDADQRERFGRRFVREFTAALSGAPDNALDAISKEMRGLRAVETGKKAKHFLDTEQALSPHRRALVEKLLLDFPEFWYEVPQSLEDRKQIVSLFASIDDPTANAVIAGTEERFAYGLQRATAARESEFLRLSKTVWGDGSPTVRSIEQVPLRYSPPTSSDLLKEISFEVKEIQEERSSAQGRADAAALLDEVIR